MGNLIRDAASIVIATANSGDIERLVEAREQFDWVIVEEAAKATGPEMVGPLMLSGRRLLIGDHYQLPPFDADRLGKILRDDSLVMEAIKMAEFVAEPLVGDDNLRQLTRIDAGVRRETASLALRLVEPFAPSWRTTSDIASGERQHLQSVPRSPSSVEWTRR